MPESFNDFLAVVYLIFILLWMVIIVQAVRLLNLSVVESLGLGTATGILLAILKEIFQFYFRKAPPTDVKK